MSKPISAYIVCPSCNEQFIATYWETLNAELNPAEKEQLIAGTLFFITCPKCNEEHPVMYPMLYHSMAHKVMIWLILNDKDGEGIRAHFESVDNLKMIDGMAQAGYRFRFVRNENELREKALIFDCNLDDRIIELLKVTFRTQFHEDHPDVGIVDILFYCDPSYKMIILAEDGNTYVIEFEKDIHYKTLESIFSQISDNSKDSIVIDQEWATSFSELSG